VIVPRPRWRTSQVAGLPVGDVVLAAVLLVVAVVTTVRMRPAEGPLVLTLPVAVAMTLAVAWRTRAPWPFLAVVVVADQLQAWLATPTGTTWSFAVLLLVAYSLGRFCADAPGVAGGALLLVSLWVGEWREAGSDYVFILVVFGGAWLLGRAVRQWQQRASAAEENQQLVARAAVAEERVRIARELHDVVAHSLSVISVQANAAEAALDHDPELVRTPLSTIKRSSREALDEMRRMLSLLRTDAEDDADPRPGLAQLDALVDSFRAAGLPVELTVRGTGTAPPAGVDVSAYRIVQEALTNVLKHAGAVPTTVEVRHLPDRVSLAVTNAVPGAPASRPPLARGAGHGLVGIRERVGLLHGSLQVGPDDAGGYGVRVDLPLQEAR
jgi:signal transduction histidine kinase